MSSFPEVNLAFNGIGPQQVDADLSLSPIILLHGLVSSKDTWNHVMRPLADGTGRKVFTYDARNHGDSGWNDHFDYECMKEDLLHFMEFMYLEKAILVGHSMGGKVGMLTALRKPEKVEKLVVEDITPKTLPPGNRRYASVYIRDMKEALEKMPEDIKDLQKAKEFVATFIYGRTPQVNRSEKNRFPVASELPLTQDQSGKFKWKHNLEVIEDILLNGSKLSSQLQRLYDEPAFFLYGTRSQYNVFNDKEFILKLFPKATFKAIEGAG
ncbi:Abhydrolase domain-containing protein 11, partial [Stegodyphus mimosarum]